MDDYAQVDVGGVTLAYRAWGEPDAPPVVLVHGNGGGGVGDWDAVAEGLSDRHRVYALDQRGYGRSDRPGRYSMELLVADLAGFVDALGLRGLVLIGHSLGGVVTYLYAARHPERVSALVVEDAGLMYPRTPTTPLRPDGELPFDWDAALAHRGEIDSPDPRWRDEALSLTVPTLFIAGGPTSFVPQHTITDLAARLPWAEVETIDAGHMVHEQRPAEYVAVVRRYLGGLSRSAYSSRDGNPSRDE